MWIDTHAHLYADAFNEDRTDMLQRAFESGVDKIILPNIDSSSISGLLELTKTYPQKIFSALGLHPCSVNDQYQEELEHILSFMSADHVVAIGETGIDLYWDKSTFDLQLKALKIQVELAIEYDLPIIIHARDSLNELIQFFEDYRGSGLRGVFHCFTGSVEQGQTIVDLGFYLGLGGILTFKNAGLDLVVPYLPKERFILETDAPYLSPKPFRGKRNESAYVRYVGKKLAEVLESSEEYISHLTTKNAEHLFFRDK
jgi:TatD DNase family protein